MKYIDKCDLLKITPKVINVGLENFADELIAQNVDIIHADWSPPAGGNMHLAKLLSKLGV